MANYFDFIDQNLGGEEKVEVSTPAPTTANVTVRVDADSILLCDGEYMEIQLPAGKMVKIAVPIGQHLFEFLYAEDPDIKIEKEVDFPEAGKSYLVIVKGLKDLVDGADAQAKAKAQAEAEAQAKAVEEAKRKVEEEARRKAEEESKRKAEEQAQQTNLNELLFSMFGTPGGFASSHVDVILKKSGTLKLQVTNLVKEFTGLGLMETKKLVDGTPSVIKRGVAKAEAEAIKKQLENLGAEVELK